MATDTRTRAPKTRGAAETAVPRRTNPERPARPVSSPRHTRPVGPLGPAGRPPQRTERAQPAERTRPAEQTRHPRRQQRMPFILLLVGLLGGALVSLLVISTTLDEGSYRITNLTNENTALAKGIQAVSNQVADAENPQTIYNEAYNLGMRPDKNLRFIDTKTGAIDSSNPVAP